MLKPNAFIIVDLKLKKRIIEFLIDQLVEDLNIDKEFEYKNLDLLMEHSIIELELQKYTFIIPYEELDKYKQLRHKKKIVFKKIERLLNKC